jgi:hypothetical protein
VTFTNERLKLLYLTPANLELSSMNSYLLLKSHCIPR